MEESAKLSLETGGGEVGEMRLERGWKGLLILRFELVAISIYEKAVSFEVLRFERSRDICSPLCVL